MRCTSKMEDKYQYADTNRRLQIQETRPLLVRIVEGCGFEARIADFSSGCYPNNERMLVGYNPTELKVISLQLQKLRHV
jgi:hypothetical protein